MMSVEYALFLFRVSSSTNSQMLHKNFFLLKYAFIINVNNDVSIPPTNEYTMFNASINFDVPFDFFMDIKQSIPRTEYNVNNIKKIEFAQKIKKY